MTESYDIDRHATAALTENEDGSVTVEISHCGRDVYSASATYQTRREAERALARLARYGWNIDKRGGGE